MNFKYLKNFRNLKAFFKDATSEDVAFIIEKLTLLHEELKNEELKKRYEEEARRKFLTGLLDSLDDHNLTVGDLLAMKNSSDKESRPKMKARYRYTDMNGEICVWSGQGKIPTALKEVMQRDGITDKNHYLIDEKDDSAS